MPDFRFNRRITVIGALLCSALSALSWRLVDLQVIRHEEFKQKAEGNTRAVVARKPLRGDIRDARGALLATSIPTKRVCADPTLMGTNSHFAIRVLSPLLGLEETVLEEKLKPKLLRLNAEGKPVYRSYVVLKEQVSLDDWEKVRLGMQSIDFGPLTQTNKTLRRVEQRERETYKLRSVFPEDDHLRLYPNGSLASHVIGFVGSVEKETTDGRIDEEVGIDGIERVLNTKLKGIRGWRETELDSKRKEVAMYRKNDVHPQPGWNVFLTLDSGLQHIVESELAASYQKHQPISASCVVVDPATGNILAMATLPTFDPNSPGKADISHRRNRVISDVVEPGSTFKMIVVSAALQEGLVGLEDRFDCENGRFVYQKRALHDAHRYGILSVEDIIAKSSNIGAAKIGIQLGQERLHRYATHFGIGTHTGVTLPGEVRGILRPLKSWDGFSITSVPMGHEVAVTQLQMAYAMAAIANRGLLMRPRLIDRLEDEDGNVMVKVPVQPVRQVVSPEVAAKMTQALRKVVSPNGTGRSIVMEHYSAAGKTGTAQKPNVGGLGRYSDDKYVASFVGFYPAADPKLLISVMLDEPHNGHTGAEAAAPVFKAIAEKAGNYMNIAPDLVPDGGEIQSVAKLGGGGENASVLNNVTGKLSQVASMNKKSSGISR